MTENVEHEVILRGEEEETREIRTKADVVWTLRKTSYEEGQTDMLAALFGADLENDPLAFIIACKIRYYGDFYLHFGTERREDCYEAMMTDFREKYPKATERALALRPMSGDSFYAKYGSDEIWRRWQIVTDRTGLHITDLFNLNDEFYEKAIIQGGDYMKSRIIWAIAGDWLDDLLDYSEYGLSIEEVARICGE